MRLANPKKLKRKRKHGFLERSKTTAGSNILRERRRRGRKQLTV